MTDDRKAVLDGHMVFLGITENDMFIVGLDKSLRVTRSIKCIFTDMKAHLG